MKNNNIKIFSIIISLALMSQALTPYFALLPQKAYAKQATEEASLNIPTPTPTVEQVILTPTEAPVEEMPTLTSTPTPEIKDVITLTATPTPIPTETLSPTPTVKELVAVSTASATLVAASFDSFVVLSSGGTYNLPQGQRVMITGDVTIDNINYYDDYPQTTAVDVITDGKAHIIYAKWGASLNLFTQDATLTYINQKYTDAVNGLSALGKTVDPTSLNQLVSAPQLSYYTPSVGSNGTYNVQANQRVMVVGDVKIDGVAYYDNSLNTIAIDVITDGKTHIITFPFGGSALVFTPAATSQYIQNTYNQAVASITGSGKTVDIKSFNQLATVVVPPFTNTIIQPGGNYIVPQGQKLLVEGDVVIDNTNYFDEDSKTTALDAIIDGNTHTIQAKWGATIYIFNSLATVQNITDFYDIIAANIGATGQMIDPTSLNQLKPAPLTSYIIPQVPAGGTYEVLAGQRVLVTADVKIDGVAYYDFNATTIVVDVLVDGKAHTLTFPWGGYARVFTPAATTQLIQQTYDSTVKSIVDSGKTVDPKSLNQLSSAIPVLYTSANLQPDTTYNIVQGQRVIIVGDVTIDNTDYFDNNSSTIALDAVTDTKAHVVSAKWGATVYTFNASATTQHISSTYGFLKSDIEADSKTIDPTSLNQLIAAPKLSYYTPSVGSNGTYNVPANQRVMVVGDVKIDGVVYYDNNSNTTAIDVLTDGKTHVITFPFGGSALVFTDAATAQYVQNAYKQAVTNVTNSGKTVDYRSLNQLASSLPLPYANLNIQAGHTYSLSQGQLAIVVGDVSIDNTDFYDDNANTIALDVITDTKQHDIYAKWGATVYLFNSSATAQNIKDTYNALSAQIQTLGIKLDPTSLNQLVPAPKLSYNTPIVGVNGTYNVPANQRVMVVGDVKIDGVAYYDNDSTTMAVDVITDGKSHVITFPFGGTALVFTDAATTQYVVGTFINELNNIDNMGKFLDPYSLIQL